MREELIREHMKLVHTIAKKVIHHSNLPPEDLIQEGTVGLMVAAEKFKPEYGCKFATYAGWWIKQAMFKAISEQSHCMKIPVYVQETLSKFSKIKREMESSAGEAVSDTEVAKNMNMKPGRLDEFLGAYSKTLSIENSDDGQRNMLDIIEDTSMSVIQAVELENLKNDLAAVISTLKEREQDVLRLRFGLEEGVKHTLEEIGNLYGVTKECIRRTEARALSKMRTSALLAEYIT